MVIVHFVLPYSTLARTKQDNALLIVTSRLIPLVATNVTLDASTALGLHYKSALNAMIILSLSATQLVFVNVVQVIIQILLSKNVRNATKLVLCVKTLPIDV